MKKTVTFLNVSWEVVGNLDKNKFSTLNEKYFRFLVDNQGTRFIVVRTEKWSPNKTKDSPRFRKCYDKHLMKRLLPREETSLVNKLIHEGYKRYKPERNGTI
jgi:hypothetical protein